MTFNVSFGSIVLKVGEFMNFFLSIEAEKAGEIGLAYIFTDIKNKLSFLRKDNPDYGTEFDNIGVIPSCVSESMWQALGWKERRLISYKRKEADIRLRMDYSRFIAETDENKYLLFVEIIIRSILVVQAKSKGDFLGDKLIEDILTALNVTKHHLYNLNKRDELLPTESFALREKIISQKEITKDDRFWCQTNPAYNPKYTEPVYMADIISFLPNALYNVRVNVESTKEKSAMYPVISVCAGKGEINFDGEAVDLYGRVSKGRVKCLACTAEKSALKVRSEFGYLGIEYGCNLGTSALNFTYGMKKEIITENKVRYFCKHPDEDNFNTLIFTVEWN